MGVNLSYWGDGRPVTVSGFSSGGFDYWGDGFPVADYVLSVTRNLSTAVAATSATSSISLGVPISLSTSVSAHSSCPAINLDTGKTLWFTQMGDPQASVYDAFITSYLLGGVRYTQFDHYPVVQGSVGFRFLHEATWTITDDGLGNLYKDSVLYGHINYKTGLITWVINPPVRGTEGHYTYANPCVVSATADIALDVALTLFTDIAAESRTPDISLYVRGLNTHATAQSVTPDTVELNIPRHLSTSISATSATTDAYLDILQVLTTSIHVVSQTSQISLLTSGLFTAVHALSSTPDVTLAVLRKLTTNEAVVSSSSAINLKIPRLLTSIPAATTSGSVNLLILRLLQTAIAAGVTTSEILVGIPPLTTHVVGGSTVPTISLDVIRDLLVSIAAATSASGALNVIRDLQTADEVVSSTSEWRLKIPLDTAVHASSGSDDIILAVLRNLVSAIHAATSASGAVSIIRELATAVAVSSLTQDVRLGILRALQTAVHCVTLADAAEMDVLRQLVSRVNAVADGDVFLVIIRELVSAIASGSATSEMKIELLLPIPIYLKTLEFLVSADIDESNIEAIVAADETIELPFPDDFMTAHLEVKT